MVNTIWFRFDLIRFRKGFSVCIDKVTQKNIIVMCAICVHFEKRFSFPLNLNVKKTLLKFFFFCLETKFNSHLVVKNETKIVCTIMIHCIRKEIEIILSMYPTVNITVDDLLQNVHHQILHYLYDTTDISEQ